MNGYIFAGILLIAAGSALTYIGVDKKNRRANEKIARDIREELKELKKQPPSVERDQKVEEVEKEFEEWAVNFIKDRDLRKAEIKRGKATVEEEEIKLSNEWRKFYSFPLEFIKNMLDAYNEKASEKITYKFPEIPNNLFSKETEDFKATIEFKDDLIWVIEMFATGSFRGNDIPSILITLSDKKKSRGSPEVMVSPYLEESFILVNKQYRRFKLVEIKDKYSLDNYEEALKEIFRKLIEYQLLELESKP